MWSLLNLKMAHGESRRWLSFFTSKAKLCAWLFSSLASFSKSTSLHDLPNCRNEKLKRSVAAHRCSTYLHFFPFAQSLKHQQYATPTRSRPGSATRTGQKKTPTHSACLDTCGLVNGLVRAFHVQPLATRTG